MENWRVAVLTAASTVGIILVMVFIVGIMQSGIVDVIKEEVEKDFCNSLPISESRDLEVCNENNGKVYSGLLEK